MSIELAAPTDESYRLVAPHQRHAVDRRRPSAVGVACGHAAQCQRARRHDGDAHPHAHRADNRPADGRPCDERLGGRWRRLPVGCGRAASGSVTIPAGSSSTTLTLTPLNNGQYLTTADFSLVSSSDFNFGASSTAAVTILEQLPSITIQATQNTADAPSGTPGTFTVTRSGPTTAGLTVNVTVSGTAVSGTDFQPIG